MRRLVVLGLGLALAAGGVGVVVGYALDDPPAPHATTPVLQVVSRWSAADHSRRLKVTSGRLSSDPRRGFVLYEEADRWIEQKNPERESNRFVRARPRFFTTDDGSGPLHIVVGSRFSWVLESSRGSRSVLEFEGERGPSFYTLGRRLDPERLPRIAARGLAVPVVYGPAKSKALVLLGRVGEATWQSYGYLAGFSLPRATSRAESLRRPLLGPDRVLYRVDVGARRLVRAGTLGRQPAQSFAIPSRCSTWEAGGAAFRTCPDSIVSVGSGRTLVQQPGTNLVPGRWTFLAESPNRRTLLLEYSVYACGTSRQAFFLPSSGGSLQPAVLDASSQSEPLGWLGDGSALVAAQSTAECEGAESSGIYQAWPGPTSAASQLVVATSSQDATLYGE